MRIFALMLLASLSINAFGQKKGELNWPAMQVDPKTNLITYTEVPEVDGVLAADIYDRAMKWGGEYFKNFSEKLKKQDKTAGEMEIFYRFPIYAYDKKGVKTTTKQGLAQFTLTIMFKDGRYKYTITDLNLKATSYMPLEPWLDREDPDAENHSYYLTDIDTEIRAIIDSMKAGLDTSGPKSSEDW